MGSVANMHLQGTLLHKSVCCAQPLSKCTCIPPCMNGENKL